MKKYLIVALLLAVGYGIAYLFYSRAQRLEGERDRYRHNTEVLMQDCERYAYRDSLSGARVEALELTLSEFKKWRAEDAALISDLRIRNKDLAAINKAQTQTIIELRAKPKDTLILWRDSILVPATRVHCGDRWFDFDGILAEGEFAGSLACRDSLTIIESIQRRRFLGFLWYTRRVKSRRLDVVSASPYTTILGVEHLIIEGK